MKEIYTPYTYRILFIPTGQEYYGVQFKQGPKNLWVSYFTSSKVIKKLIQEHGKDAFEIVSTEIHTTVQELRNDGITLMHGKLRVKGRKHIMRTPKPGKLKVKGRKSTSPTPKLGKLRVKGEKHIMRNTSNPVALTAHMLEPTRYFSPTVQLKLSRGSTYFAKSTV